MFTEDDPRRFNFKVVVLSSGETAGGAWVERYWASLPEGSREPLRRVTYGPWETLFFAFTPPALPVLDGARVLFHLHGLRATGQVDEQSRTVAEQRVLVGCDALLGVVEAGFFSAGDDASQVAARLTAAAASCGAGGSMLRVFEVQGAGAGRVRSALGQEASRVVERGEAIAALSRAIADAVRSGASAIPSAADVKAAIDRSPLVAQLQAYRNGGASGAHTIAASEPGGVDRYVLEFAPKDGCIRFATAGLAALFGVELFARCSPGAVDVPRRLVELGGSSLSRYAIAHDRQGTAFLLVPGELDGVASPVPMLLALPLSPGEAEEVERVGPQAWAARLVPSQAASTGW